MLQPTSPLRELQDIQSTYQAVSSNQFSSSLTVHKVDKKFHPLKSLRINDTGTLEFFLDDGKNIIARQQLSDVYIRNGASYCIKTDVLCTEKSLFTRSTKPVITQPMISIDSIEDLLDCETTIVERRSLERKIV